METLGCTGLFVQLNLGPQAMAKPWANRDPGGDGEQQDAEPQVQAGMFLCEADNAAFL